MKNLLLVRPGTLTPEQMKKVNKDLIVIETDDFTAFKLINTEFLLTTDDFAIAALETLNDYTGGYSKDEKFARRILDNMKAKRGAPSVDVKK